MDNQNLNPQDQIKEKDLLPSEEKKLAISKSQLSIGDGVRFGFGFGLGMLIWGAIFIVISFLSMQILLASLADSFRLF